MSVGLLIITHGRLGEHLLDTAKSMMGVCPLQTTCVSVSQSSDPDRILQQALAACHELNHSQGVLVLTDMYGSTPSNIANRLLARGRVQVIAGLNLPMLIRVMNYHGLDLRELARKALSGGHDGILLCEADTS